MSGQNHYLENETFHLQNALILKYQISIYKINQEKQYTKMSKDNVKKMC